MANIIQKYPLSLMTEQVINIPSGAKILSVSSEEGKISLSALVQQGNKSTGHSVELHPEGVIIKDPPPFAERIYIGHAMAVGINFHVFELHVKQ